MSGESEIDFQFLAENSVDILCRAGIDRMLRYVSPSSLHVLGWKPEEMTGKLMDHFILPEDLPVLAAAIATDFPSGTQIVSTTMRMRKRDGSTTWMENRAQRVRNTVTGELTDFVVTMRDVSERKRFEEQLSALALTDSLTQLPNRRAFDQAWNVSASGRCGRGRSSLCCCLMSIISRSLMISMDIGQGMNVYVR